MGKPRITTKQTSTKQLQCDKINFLLTELS